MMTSELLKGLAIAVTGDFGEQRSHDKMRNWIQYHGGKFVYEVTAEATHLVCSEAHFKKRVTMVKHAQHYSVKIVTYDWLEDTLLKRKLCSEHDYRLEKSIRAKSHIKAKKRAIRKDNIERGMQEFERGCKESEKDMFSDGYHVYTDPTGFAYDITLARVNLATNKNQRYSLKVGATNPLPIYASFAPYLSTPCLPMYRTYGRVPTRWPCAQQLQLYESHSVPRMYACYTKYSSPGQNERPEMIAPIGSGFDIAFEGFKLFFRMKTMKDWSRRLASVYNGKKVQQVDDGAPFLYVPSKEGEPKGILGYDDLETKVRTVW